MADDSKDRPPRSGVTPDGRYWRSAGKGWAIGEDGQPRDLTPEEEWRYHRMNMAALKPIK